MYIYKTEICPYTHGTKIGERATYIVICLKTDFLNAYIFKAMCIVFSMS